jgi:exopolysaccharide production protein ExoZ
MYKNLQVLRVVAAMMVMLFHGASIYFDTVGAARPMTWVAKYGYIGVDIFFAISGFVAAHTTLARARNWHDMPTYAIHRLARIFLGYWPFYALSLAVAAVYTPSMLQQWDWLKSLFLVFLWGASDPREMVLYVSWSLSYELIFYTLVAASFALPLQRARQAFIAITLVVTAVLAGALQQREPLVLWAFLAFLLEFLMGAMVRLLAPKLFSRWWLLPAAIVAAGSIAIGLHGEPPQGAVRAFTLGLGGACIVMLTVVLEQTGAVRAPRWMIALGASSYTLYLAHVIFWSLFSVWGIGAWLSKLPPPLRSAGFWLSVGICVTLSHLFYRTVEAPLYRRAIARWPKLPSHA